MNADKTIARVAGVLFITATVASLIGAALTGSILSAADYLTEMAANGTRIFLGALFAFIAAATSASIAISMYPILKKRHQAFALGAVGFRLLEGALYMVGIICMLSLFALSKEFVTAGEPVPYFETLGSLLIAARDLSDFVFGATTFSLGALMYYSVFYRSRLLPRWLSAWGILGAVLLISASAWTVFDGAPFSISGKLLFLVIPIGLQEMVLAVWLIVKGFEPPAGPSTSWGDE